MRLRPLIFAIVMAASVGESYAITVREAADAILNRNGDRMLTELDRTAKDAATLSIANAPDPVVEGDYLVAPKGEENRWGVAVSYELDWPGAYAARSKAGEAMRNANSAEADADILAKRMEITEALLCYVNICRRLELMRKVQSANDTVRILVKKASQGGQLSRLDASKIEIEQNRLQNMIANEEIEKLSAEGMLRTFNGGQPCTSLLERLDLEWEEVCLAPLATYLSKAGNNPEIAKAMSEYAVEEKNVTVAKAERLPGFSIGYSHEYEDGIHFNGANLGISIPLFSSRRKVKAAEAAKAAAEYKMTVATDRLESEVTRLYQETTALEKAIKTPSEIFSNTDYTEMLMKAYRGGELSLTEYLTELGWFYEAHLDYIELRYQMESKATRLSMLAQ